MLQQNPDPFDPTLWVDDAHEFRIYGDAMAQTWAVVDEVDYQWAIAWRWCRNIKKSRGNPDKIKIYMRRAVGDNANGVRLRTETVYLHIEILRRTGATPPTKFHTICDHRDGDTMNCRRSNLRWATHSMNSLNRFGAYPYDLVEDVLAV